MKQRLAQFFHIEEKHVLPVIVWGIIIFPLAFIALFLTGLFW